MRAQKISIFENVVWIWICFLDVYLDLDLFFAHLGLIQIYSDIFRFGFGFDAIIWVWFGFVLKVSNSLSLAM